MSGQMANLFQGMNVSHVLANRDFIEMPESHQMRFNPKSNPQVQGAFILVYAPWCPHCNDPTWQNKYAALTHFLENKSELDAYAMNATIPENYDWTDKMKIQGLPTILMANNKGEIAEYEGDRELTPMMESLVDFLVQTNKKQEAKPRRRSSAKKTRRHHKSKK